MLRMCQERKEEEENGDEAVLLAASRNGFCSVFVLVDFTTQEQRDCDLRTLRGLLQLWTFFKILAKQRAHRILKLLLVQQQWFDRLCLLDIGI